MPSIFHFTSRSEWEASQKIGFHITSSLSDEGFIHCCNREQVNSVYHQYFWNQPDVLILEINPDLLKSQVVYEWATSLEQIFPHVYGSINTDAVVQVMAGRQILTQLLQA